MFRSTINSEKLIEQLRICKNENDKAKKRKFGKLANLTKHEQEEKVVLYGMEYKATWKKVEEMATRKVAAAQRKAPRAMTWARL
jgi:hypothetical protein